MADAVQPIVGRNSILTLNGEEWKSLRQLFSRGFSNAHLMENVGMIVDEVLVFTQKLAELAESGEVVCLEEHVTRLTFDIIGGIVLDVGFHSQDTQHELVDAFRKTVRSMPDVGSSNPLVLYNPISLALTWWHERRLNIWLNKYLEDRFALQFADGRKISGRKKRIIDQALDMFQEEQEGSGANSAFKQLAIDK
jgi:cytochrome P450